MLRRALFGFVVLSSLFAGLACSAGTGEVAVPKPGGTAPAPSATGATGAKTGRPSPCDVARLLVAKADELREKGHLARAARALDDAEARCPEEGRAIAEPVRSRVNEARKASGDEAVRLSAAGVASSFDLQWAKDGSRAAVLRGDEISIYDADLRKEEARYPVEPGTHDLAWLPSGKGLIAVTRETKSYRLLDVENRKLGERVELGRQVAGLAVSRDGKSLVLESSGLWFWDLAAKKPIGEIVVPANVTGVAWSPSGDRIAVGSADGEVRLFTFPALAVTSMILPLDRSAEGSPDPVFLTDERLFVVHGARAATFDGNGNKVGKRLQHDGCTGTLFGERGVLWVCGTKLDVDDALTGKRTHLFTPPEASQAPGIDVLRSAPDGGSVWYSMVGQQGLVDAQTGKLIPVAKVPDPFFDVRIRPGSKRLAAVDADRAALWTSDLSTDQRAVIGPSGPSLACSRLGVDGLGAPVFADVALQAAELPAEGRIALRRAGSDAPEAPPSWFARCPSALSEDASRIALFGRDDLRVARTDSWSVDATIPLDPKTGETGKLSRDGKRVLVWGRTGMRVIDVATSAVLATWKHDIDRHIGVDFSPSGNRVLFPDGLQGFLYEVGREAPTTHPFPGGAMKLAGDDTDVEVTGTAVLVRSLTSGQARPLQGPPMGFWIDVAPDGKKAVSVASKEAWLVDLTPGGGPAVQVGPIDLKGQIVFFPRARAFALFDPTAGVARFRSVSSGAPLGELRRVGVKGAVYLSPFGNVEILGDGAGALTCLRGPAIVPVGDCLDGFAEKGLLARTMAGRGCTSEDVGDVCE